MRLEHKIDLTPKRIMPSRLPILKSLLSPLSSLQKTNTKTNTKTNIKIKDRSLFNAKKTKDRNIVRKMNRNIKYTTYNENNDKIIL
jgi:hypothetical protein